MSDNKKLSQACKAGDLEEVKRLVKTGVSIYCMATYARVYNQHKIVKYLLMAGKMRDLEV